MKVPLSTMVFDTSSPSSSSSSNQRSLKLDHMFNSSTAEPPLSDERDLSQIEAANKQQPAKWKMISKRRQSCTNDMYATAASRYHRSKPSSTLNNLSVSDETLASVSQYFSSYDKFNNKLSSDDVKYFRSQSALVTTRRSTTDCTDLKPIHQQPFESTNNTMLTIVDEESRDSIWLPSGKRKK